MERGNVSKNEWGGNGWAWEMFGRMGEIMIRTFG